MRHGRLLLAALALAGCADMRRAPPAEPAPVLSGGRVVQPLPAIIALAAQDFDLEGAGLAGRPAATALAAARLEWLAAEGRLPAVALSYRMGLQRGVEVVRASLAIRPEVSTDAAVAALVAAHAALERGIEPSFPASVFRETVPPARRRLAEPGPQPDAYIATAALREEYTRLQAEQATDPRLLNEVRVGGATTFGLGEDVSR